MSGLSSRKTVDIFSNLHRNAFSLSQVSDSLAANAKEMMDFSIKINDRAKVFKENFNQINSDILTISSSVEEFAVNMKTIAENAERSKGNIDSITNSTKELSDAASEIAKNTSKARDFSTNSLNVLKEASQSFDQLKNASNEIDIVTQSVTAMADQTNLLALNATIEAARAGSAGKGFSVVAGEVKELARQSKDATETIAAKVGIIQEGISATVSSMGKIDEVINELNNFIDIIAAATEEQSITSKNISANINEFLNQINTVIENVAQSETAIDEVNKKLANSASSSEEMYESATLMNKDSDTMRKNSIAIYAYTMEASGSGKDLYKEIKKVNIPEKVINSIAEEKSVLARFTKEYDVNVEAMNVQHQKIFHYINQVHKELKEKSSFNALVPVMRDLESFTARHFSDEEALLSKIKYPEITKQKNEHAAYMSKIREYILELEADKVTDLIAVLVFLKNWLFNHILVEDKKYSPYMNKSGIQ